MGIMGSGKARCEVPREVQDATGLGHLGDGSS